MRKANFHDGVAFVEVDLIKKERFAFVEDEVLKENVAINAQYITFLFSLERTYNYKANAIRYSIFLTIIVYAAGIAESLLSYVLQRMVQEGKFTKSELLEAKKEITEIKEICCNQNGDRVIWGIEKEKERKWDATLTFANLITAAKKSKCFNKDLMKKCDDLRDKRNKIHLSGLDGGDNFFSEEDVQEVFNFLGEFIREIHSLCS